MVTILGEDDATVLQSYTLDLPSPFFGTNSFFGVAGFPAIGGVIIQAQTFVGIDNLAAVEYAAIAADTVEMPVPPWSQAFQQFEVAVD